jgi:hypothetical protein
MQVKLFSRPLTDLAGLENQVNQWLAANAKLIAIQRDSAVYHDHGSGGEGVLLTLWYEAKGNL